MMPKLINRKKIIVTLGPSTLHEDILKKINVRDVDYVRINLSHTPNDKIEDTIIFVKKHIDIPLIIDTEGSQIRTGDLNVDRIEFIDQQKVRLYNKPVKCNNNNLYLRPPEALDYLTIGDIIFIDFDTVILRVDEIEPLCKYNYILCSVVSGGIVGNNKAVTVEDQTFSLPALSKKDLLAVEICKKHNIDLINLSFVDSKDDINQLLKIYPEAKVISKIETRQGVNNLDEIIELSDAILIDRGDLSREVPFERIAFAQKLIMRSSMNKNKPAFVATNLLDTMMNSLRPSRAEVNDIINTLLDGASGLVLAAETAIGNYPLQTINFMRNLCNETTAVVDSGLFNKLHSNNIIDVIDSVNYITSPIIGSSLINPHGGKLVNRLLKCKPEKKEIDKLPFLYVNREVSMDAEQISVGAFSPLEGFMNSEDLYSVLDTMRLPDGTVWTLPVILQITDEEKKRLKNNSKVLLIDKESGQKFAIINIEEIYSINKDAISKKWFGTSDKNHPGVKNLYDNGNYLVGGKIDLIERLNNEYKFYELTPAQTRRIFESKGWTRIIGFHSRNVIHRSHEYVQLTGLQESNCDGIMIHPVIGKKKKGDFSTSSIINSYEIMINQFYPTGKVFFSTFATYSRYSGPREAVFTAICRQNFGCSHFIIGRDHTGVGNYYKPDESQRIFDQFPDLEIRPVFFDQVFFCKDCNTYRTKDKCKHDDNSAFHISGSKVREMLKHGETPPEWFMRPEITEILINRVKNGQSIFVE